MEYVYYSLAGIATFFAWATIHELSHLLLVKRAVGVTWFKIIPYPHIVQGQFYFARVVYLPKETPSDEQLIKIHLAPRLPDVVACFILGLTQTLLSHYYTWFSEHKIILIIWLIFWFGGVVDLFVGSLGIRRNSDLRRASKLYRHVAFAWILRTLGILLVVAVTIMSVGSVNKL